MKIQYAVLSFCKDLTDPKATSFPVGIFGLSAKKNSGFWFYVCADRPGDRTPSADEWSKAILNNLPSLLHDQIAEGLKTVAPDNFLHWLHDRFRNSLHVSNIEAKDVDVDEKNVSSQLTRLYLQVVSSASESGKRRRTAPKTTGLPNIEVRTLPRELVTA